MSSMFDKAKETGEELAGRVREKFGGENREGSGEQPDESRDSGQVMRDEVSDRGKYAREQGDQQQ